MLFFDRWLSFKCKFCISLFALSFSFQEKVPIFLGKKNINMELNMITVVFLVFLFNVMHLSIMFWHCIINYNKMKFRAQSEKLFCLISLLPFTRSVNMTEPLSCIWVCVCWTRAVIWYLNRLLWGACPLTVWGHSQTKLNTHSPCTNISVSTAACFHYISACISAFTMFFKEKSYIKGQNLGEQHPAGVTKA